MGNFRQSGPECLHGCFWVRYIIGPTIIPTKIKVGSIHIFSVKAKNSGKRKIVEEMLSAIHI